jgi:hypothetical protein
MLFILVAARAALHQADTQGPGQSTAGVLANILDVSQAPAFHVGHCQGISRAP